MQQKHFKKIIFFTITFVLVLFAINYSYAADPKPPLTPFDAGYGNNASDIKGVGDQVTDNGAVKGVGDQVTDKNPKKPVVSPGPNEGLHLIIKNPLGVQTIEEVIQKIMAVIVKLAIPVIICFFIFSGFKFITAQGDKKQLEEAKTMFVQVVIGSVIILGAWTIASAIISTVNLITG